MMSSTGWRVAALITPNKSLVVSAWPRSRISSRMVRAFHRGFEGCERCVVLARGFAHGGTHHQFEQLVFAEAGGARFCHVALGQRVCVGCDLGHERSERLRQARVCKRRPALLRLCLS